MAIDKKITLRSYKNKIKYGKKKHMGFSQGWAINYLIKRYKIQAIAWGTHIGIISIETKKQYLFWRDMGHSLEFKGILNKTKSDIATKVKSIKTKK
ncbi:MAG: hypothetical protein ISS18_15160 [Bacteroidales bacterium]|nr:hypothetical protein [Bacteroidales bacterium]